MEVIKKYKGKYTGPQVDDLLGRVPIVESRVNMLEDGGGDKTYVFAQSNPSSEWVIEHNLNKHPSVTVVEYYSNKEVLTEVVHESTSKVIVRFNENIKGKAYLN